MSTWMQAAPWMRASGRGPARAVANVRQMGALLAAAAAVAALAGCTATVSAAPAPPPSSGSAIMDWTIDGTRDPAECQATGASTFNVTLFSSTGATAGQWVQDCTAFATTIPGLFPDTYTGRANLVDPGGNPRTTAVPLAPFDVVEGTTVTVPMDFPINSFL